MAQTERQTWSGSTAAAPVPTKGSAASSAVFRLAAAVEAAPTTATPWDVLCHLFSEAQQADLLRLASEQGLLYSHQIIPSSSPPRPNNRSEEPRAWNLLGKLLAGHVSQLASVRPLPIEVHDTALDEAQRFAVASALATPDVFLIQGLPGSGKARVAAELVTQATGRGDRVLLLASESPILDRVLEQIAKRDSVCPVRCLGPHERSGELPIEIRALTWEGRAAALRDRTLLNARKARQVAELQCARRRHEEPLWARLEELVEVLGAALAELAAIESKMELVPADVARDADAPKGRIGEDVRSLRKAGENAIAGLESEISSASQRRDQEAAKLRDAEQRLAVLESLHQARANRCWWTFNWWKAAFTGRLAERVSQARAEKDTSLAALETSNDALQNLEEQRRRASERTAGDVMVRMQAETESRQGRLRSTATITQNTIDRHEALWSELCKQFEPESLRPSGQTASEVQAARARWQAQRCDDEARCGFARQWAEFLETSNDSLASRLPGYVNLVAATPAALATDAHFSDAAGVGGSFDLLVLLEGDKLPEGDFLKAARRARRWVLIGQPTMPADGQRSRRTKYPTSDVNGASRRNPFFELWDHLHFDPCTLPYTWFRENQRLVCRLRRLDADERKRLESEPLADAPDVELRILALPHSRPVLAEVMFPGAMSVPAAKEFLYRELQEFTLQTTGSNLRWQESLEKTTVHFEDDNGALHETTLETGLCEYLGGAHYDRTVRLEFTRAAGWDRDAIERWLEQHLGVRDLGRTACLNRIHRMSPPLSAVVGDWLGLFGNISQLEDAESHDPAVEFVAVSGPTKHKPGPRPTSTGARPTEGAASGLPSAGAGLEIDLAALRPGDRVPAEVRSLVSSRGYVNLPEAKAVIRRLEKLLHHSPAGNGRNGSANGSVAVIALYSGQAELIRELVKHSPRLAPHAAHVCVGLPGAFAHREADVVIVSLTRSHSHRAVSYGEGPTELLLALTRARRKLILIGDSGNLVRRGQWRSALDHLDESRSHQEARLIGQILRYLQGHGRNQRAFRIHEGNTP